MEATVENVRTQTREDYQSRPGAWVWFFRKSRDGWKRQYQDLKATVNGSQNRIADLTRSRAQWRLQAEQAGQHLSVLEAENAVRRAQMATVEEKKKRTREAAR
jgi:hypothetical protein